VSRFRSRYLFHQLDALRSAFDLHVCTSCVAEPDYDGFLLLPLSSPAQELTAGDTRQVEPEQMLCNETQKEQSVVERPHDVADTDTIMSSHDAAAEKWPSDTHKPVHTARN
jgi:hypothetical protein